MNSSDDVELSNMLYYFTHAAEHIRKLKQSKTTRRRGRKHRSPKSLTPEEAHEDNESSSSSTPTNNASFLTQAKPRKHRKLTQRNRPKILLPGTPSDPMSMSEDSPNTVQTSSPTHSPMVQSTPEAYESDELEQDDTLQYCSYNVVASKYKEDAEQFMLMSTLPRMEHERVPMNGVLLPPKPANDKRPTLVLDLDETLVHAFLNIEDYDQFDWVFQVDNEDMVLDIYCQARPWAQHFLQEMSKDFELVIFTASQEKYASQVLDRLDPHGYISHRLYRDSCSYFQGNYIKDLSMLGRPLSRTIILDNSPLAFAFQPLNGVPCHTWTCEKDDVELYLLIETLRNIAACPDVRPKIDEMYAMGKLLAWLKAYIEKQQNTVSLAEED